MDQTCCPKQVIFGATMTIQFTNGKVVTEQFSNQKTV